LSAVVAESDAPDRMSDPNLPSSTEPASDDWVRIVPLGGLGEIGANCLVLEQLGEHGLERVMVDCGATFPHDDYGVDYLHPRFDHLLAQPDALAGVVLTHAHEDHIGALAALARSLQAAGSGQLAIWGRPHALALARYRFDEEGVTIANGTPPDKPHVVLNPVEMKAPFAIGSFEVELVPVTHSIPEAGAVALRTRAGVVVHSGDFKFDPAPGDGQLTDEVRLGALGDQGVGLLLSDSTNALREGTTGSERQAAETLDGLIGSASGRVVVGLFSSNLHRVSSVAAACLRHGRRLVLLGRSVQKHVEVGRAVGLLKWPSDLVAAPSKAGALPPTSVVYLATGTQGESRGALARLARGTHPDLHIQHGDRVVLSSRIIPGCERDVHRMTDALVARGAELVTARSHPGVHVSGHACRGEQERMIELIRPRCFVPLHGTLQHMHRHAELARDMGVAQVEVLKDGHPVRLEAADDGLRLVREPRVPAGKVAINKNVVLEDDVLSERRRLGRAGVVVVVVMLESGQVVRVAVSAHGVPCHERVVAESERIARSTVASGTSAVEARRSLRQRLEELIGSRPTVDLTIVELEK
jgi:ribonuclease J